MLFQNLLLLIPIIILIYLILFTGLTIAKIFYRDRFRSEVKYLDVIDPQKAIKRRKKYKAHKQEEDRTGFIYGYRGKWELTNLILIKIGRTNNMEQRMSAAKTSNPFGIELLFCFVVKDDVYAETFIHHKFSKLRINKNNEWFWCLPQVWFYMWCISNKKLVERFK